MLREVASKVLKVMLVWLLVLFAFLVFQDMMPETISELKLFQDGFFVGAILAGTAISLIAMIILAVSGRSAKAAADKKNYATVGMMLAAFDCFMALLGACYEPVMVMLFGSEITAKDWYIWVENIVITYVICLAVAMLIGTQCEKTPIEKHKMTFGQFICAIFMNAGIIGVGAILGAVIDYLLQYNFGITGGGQNISNMMFGSNDVWRVLTVGIGAPIVEELIFRKFIIDRVHKYGEGIAIFVSGFLFGLFHGNFSQFFFATGVGLFFAFIYVRTGKIWYSILLHMVVNLSTSLVSVNLLEMMDLEKIDSFLMMDMASEEATAMAMELLPGMLLFLGWILFIVVCAIIGWVLWIVKRKKLFLKKSEEYVEKKRFRMAFGNFGMLVFLVLCIIRFLSFYI
jgi:membrane protease YdiL (CAAX protease family)